VILQVSLYAGPQAPCAVAVDDPNRAGRSLGKVLFQNGLSISNGFPPQIEGVLAGAQVQGSCGCRGGRWGFGALALLSLVFIDGIQLPPWHCEFEDAAAHYIYISFDGDHFPRLPQASQPHPISHLWHKLHIHRRRWGRVALLDLRQLGSNALGILSLLQFADGGSHFLTGSSQQGLQFLVLLLLQPGFSLGDLAATLLHLLI
jgi:hypothetical protein